MSSINEKKQKKLSKQVVPITYTRNCLKNAFHWSLTNTNCKSSKYRVYELFCFFLGKFWTSSSHKNSFKKRSIHKFKYCTHF